MPLSVLLRDRIADFWPDLEDLAHALASPANVVEPTSAIACYELLTHGSESPLYNPVVPREELALRVHHIRAGIHQN